MKTRLPAVVMAPPELGVPVWMPLAASSSNSPSVTCHAMSPVFALTATSSPHGGSVQLHRLAGSQNRPPSGVCFDSAGGNPPDRPAPCPAAAAGGAAAAPAGASAGGAPPP